MKPGEPVDMKIKSTDARDHFTPPFDLLFHEAYCHEYMTLFRFTMTETRGVLTSAFTNAFWEPNERPDEFLWRWSRRPRNLRPRWARWGR